MADESYDEFNNSSFTHNEKCLIGMMHGFRDGDEQERQKKQNQLKNDIYPLVYCFLCLMIRMLFILLKA